MTDYFDRDIEQPRVCQSSIILSVPAWKARFSPFDNGIVTMPQKKENFLQMWNASQLDSPVFTFSGHTDLPREFVWRKRHNKTGIDEYQLLTWSKDQHMRFWALDDTQRNVCILLFE